MSETFVVVGLGSMGKRRVRDLKTLHAGKIIGVDAREDRRAKVSEEFGVETLSDFDAAMKLKPRAVMVSVPPHLHHRFCVGALDAGAAYFVECLTTLTLTEMDDLVRRERTRPGRAFPSVTPLMTPSFQYTAEKVSRGGKVYAVHASCATWLPNQHPWEKQVGDHYEFHRNQGGGLAEPAYFLSWLCTILRQRPVSVIAHAAHVSELPQGFNDLLDMIIVLDGGTVINFHYTLCEKQDWTVGIFHRFSCEGGTAVCKATESRFYSWEKRAWDHCTLPAGWKYDDIYLAEMKHFLAALDGKEQYLGSLEIERAGIATLLAAEESSRTGQKMEIK